MRRILIRPAADADLEHQARYIAASSGPEAARRFYRSAEQTMRLIASTPGIGKTAPYRNRALANTRMFRVKGFPSHLIFYRRIAAGIEIIRVIHGARDIENLFE